MNWFEPRGPSFIDRLFGWLFASLAFMILFQIRHHHPDSAVAVDCWLCADQRNFDACRALVAVPPRQLVANPNEHFPFPKRPEWACSARCCGMHNLLVFCVNAGHNSVYLHLRRF